LNTLADWSAEQENGTQKPGSQSEEDEDCCNNEYHRRPQPAPVPVQKELHRLFASIWISWVPHWNPSDFSWKAGRSATTIVGYVAVVRISKAGAAVAVFSPLRFGESQGKPFVSEADALMGGYSAGRRIVDDLFTS
jgi:hypothetical protein